MINIKEILKKIKKEEDRNLSFLHLTANEAQVSETARRFLGSKLSERYFMTGANAEGFVDYGALTALGFNGVEELVHEAEEATKRMLKASVVNLSCLSGVHAMMCAILSTTKPGDVIMTVEHNSGGHFATQGIIEVVGRGHVFAPFDIENLRFDISQLAETYKKNNVKAIYLDVSYYLNPHNLKEIREAVGENAVIIYDASHTMGLILGQQFQSPFIEGADVICANTHKTLPGPQKGMIAFRDEVLGNKANDIINGCLYSSPHLHHMIALSITLLEMEEYGLEYAKQIINNSNQLAKKLVELGYEIRKSNTGEYSHNHQVHLMTESIGDRLDLYRKLLENQIAVNFDEPLGAKMFIRLGTQEITRRGMKEQEMDKIAEFLDKSFKGENLSSEVQEFNQRYNKIKYSFDS